MQLRKKPVPGRCNVNRCVKEAAPPEGNPHGLCAQHYNEWIAAGSPDLTAAPAPKKQAPGSDIAVIQTELEPVRNQLDQVLQFVAAVPFDATCTFGAVTMSGLEALGAMREEARQKLKELESKRTSITKPLLAAKRAADEVFAPATQQCEAVMNTCTSRLTDYERQRLAAQREAAALVQTTPDDPHLLAVAHGAAEPLPAQVSTRVVFTYEVLDFAAVPDECKQIDDHHVRERIRLSGGTIEIPGIRVVQDVKVVAA